ncbi:MAG: hypothetical protein ACI8W7_003578 [Gammaproteobacteria bacterium]|jgi:hypothetical protein
MRPEIALRLRRGCPRGAVLTFHRVKEFAVVLGRLDAIKEKFDRLNLFHRVQQFAQNPDFLK